ncbi:cytidylyltransferase domain-containing protein [Synechococcus sp. UW105]|uniref:acylneuraminate cytidylyltransferase family protein n=1 Tax=Synechococcus sp. UW105 TaxID=337067 RepID=UPI000E0E1C1F|nr:acylneuraminate cytidylyltransferase family protein [Synechococcus sp. UW105]
MVKIIALIPARSGSKGVPNKNVRLLGGRSLLEWSIAASLKSRLIERTIVSTDSPEYASLSIGLGAEVPFIRPASISGDTSTDYEFIKHALEWLDANNTLPEYIVHIRPTTPFRNPRVVDDAIEAFIESEQATALRSVHLMSESAYKTFELSSDGRLKRLFSESTQLDMANNARQVFPDTYSANGYVDVLSVSFILRNKIIHGDYVLPFLTPPAPEIDTESDFVGLEQLIEIDPSISSSIFGPD